ncbi:uncharacterized protein LOC118418662 [Branchiostoma floridae]|uniref:Uncharacterized protein LOC118418662 n=1 Tax=Branchiostoma floridae TaxID=7739 RepID=A0A9J7LDN1_BRAFL|nr:uncharacterized protein LOC118418662 [Branchiostoma floridae]
MSERKDGGKPYYAYELVVRYPKKGRMPMPCATLVTNNHSVPHITFFLQSFRYAESKVYHHNTKVNPRLIMADRRMALIISPLNVYCTETLQRFLDRCYRIVTGVAKAEDIEMTINHTCASHSMKNAKIAVNKHYKSKKKFGMYVMVLLLRTQ